MFIAPRGTYDILPGDQLLWRFFESKATEVAARFGYGRIDTPLFEDARLFARGIGEVTDIVEKETYSFEDRGGDLMTLRPEGTASVVRAYIQHGMSNLPQPVRLYYICPIFRYERPQAGRYRQHFQFGIEAIGDRDPSVDAEVIEVGWRFLEAIGLTELSLRLNSIGDRQCRPLFIEALQSHYTRQTGGLCEDCARRHVRNPLRLLDCKQDSCQPIIESAPHMIDFLCDGCAGHWTELQFNLEAMDIPLTVDHRLVRGFDYYTRTVFEIIPPVEGRQNTLVGGGRYDRLVEELDGPPTPGMGFGMGIDRALENLRRQVTLPSESTRPKVVIAHLGGKAKIEGIRTASALRKGGIIAVLAPSGRSLKSQMRYASSELATHAVIIGDDELERGTFILRDMTIGEQRDVPAKDLVEAIEQI